MTNLEATIDALGDVKEQIKELEKRETELKKDLKTLGVGTHIGSAYILTISEQDRKTLDMEAVREKLSDQFIRAHTTVSTHLVFRPKKKNEIEKAA